MAVTIKLKNSVTQDAVPTTTHLPAVGELALNANINSLGIYMRASDNSIVKMAGPGSVSTVAASTTVAGISEYATNAETTTGTSTTRSVTPAGLKAVTDAERTTSNSTYLALAGGTLTGVLAATAGSNSAPSIHFGDSDSGIFGGTNTVSLAAGGTTRLTADTGVSVVGTLAVTGAITSTSDITLADKLIHSGDTNTAIRFPAADTFSVETGGAEALRVDSSQRLLVASSSSRTIWGANPKVQIEGTDSNAAFTLIRNQASTAGPWIALAKSRGASNGSHTIVQDGDSLGSINWFGADGVDLAGTSGEIRVEVDGTPGSNDLPGRLVFKTTADGANAPTERLRITSTGMVKAFGDLYLDNGTNAGKDIHWDESNNYLNFSDAVKAVFGGSNDLQVYHDGSNSYLANDTGQLNIDGASGDAIRFLNNGNYQCNIGSTGLNFPDDKKIRLGDSEDLEIYHDGTDSTILNDTGILELRGNDIRLMNNAGNEHYFVGFVNSYSALYYDNVKRFETTDTGSTVTGILRADEFRQGDDEKIKLGSSEDLELFHNGTDSWVKNITGKLRLCNTNGNGNQVKIGAREDQDSIIINPLGSTEIYHNGSKTLETTADGITIGGDSGVAGNWDLEVYNGSGTSYCIFAGTTGGWLELRDTGSSELLEIRSGGGGSSIRDKGTGDLNISGSIVRLQSSGFDTLCRGVEDGAFELYFDNSKKFETYTGGCIVTGQLSADAVSLGDGEKILLGSGDDIELYHDSADSHLVNKTGVLYIKNNAKFSIVAKQNAEVELYHNDSKKFNTSSTGAEFHGAIVKQTGTGETYHAIGSTNAGGAAIYLDGDSDGDFAGSDYSWIRHRSDGDFEICCDDPNNTSSFYLKVKDGTASAIDAITAAGVKLYYDGNLKFETSSTGSKVSGRLDVDGDLISHTAANNSLGLAGHRWNDLFIANDIDITDDGKILLGTGDDLQIFHQASNSVSYIQQTIAAQHLIIKNTNADATGSIWIEPRAGETAAKFDGATGEVSLRYGGNEKFTTSSTGATVHGNLKLSGGTGTDLEIHTDNAAGIVYKADENGHKFQSWTGSAWETAAHFQDNLRVKMPEVYSTSGSSMRDVQIESNGTLCGQSSIRAAKTNIAEITDVNWIYDLKPVSFNFRKKTVNDDGTNTYLDEAETEKAHGLIAEEVEAVNQDFCFYDKDKDGKDVLAGVYYKTLISPLIKVVQEQKKEIDILKTQVAALGG